MKKYISTLLGACALMALATSCGKDTEGMTGIAYYPVFELQGNPQVVIAAGTAYNDPGAVATIGGRDVSDEIKVSTQLDFADPKPGYYTIVYSVVNSDGFAGTTSRDVIVASVGDEASGFYTVQPDSYRDYGSVTYFGGYPMIVYGDGSGIYKVSDLLGGWYQYRAGYGVNYALSGEISIAADGAVSLTDSFLPGWADGAEEMENGRFDSQTGTLSWDVMYAGMHFSLVASRD